jgi:hypothetical protein
MHTTGKSVVLVGRERLRDRPDQVARGVQPLGDPHAHRHHPTGLVQNEQDPRPGDRPRRAPARTDDLPQPRPLLLVQKGKIYQTFTAIRSDGLLALGTAWLVSDQV